MRWTLAAFVPLIACLSGCEGPRGESAPQPVAEQGEPPPVVPIAAEGWVDATPSLAAEGGGPLGAISPEALRETLAAFNRGAAWMEQYQYSKGAEEFGRVLRDAPDWTAARFNHGLACLNMLGSSLDAARDAFSTILQDHPDHLPARFSLGMYHQHLGNLEAAADCFHKVHEADRDDLHAAYKCAESLRAVNQHAEAIAILEDIIERDPGFVSAVYLLATLYTRSGQRERALPLFERFKALNAAELTGGSHVVQQTYGTAGKYYRVLGADDLPLPAREEAKVSAVVFSPETRTLPVECQTWESNAGTVHVPGLAVADVDGDGDLDLCLSGVNASGSATMLLNDGQGVFTAGSSVAERVVSPCFGDVDNDGHIDLWLGRDGDDQLLMNDGRGGFRLADLRSVGSTAEAAERPSAGEAIAGTAGQGSGAAEGGASSSQPARSTSHLARLVDLDSDGDVDLLTCGKLPGSVAPGQAVGSVSTRLLLNHRDGTWKDAAEALGLAIPETVLTAIVYDDFDNDYDLDLVLFPDGGSPILWINDRLGAYRLVEGSAAGLDVVGAVNAVSADPDKDGDRDLLIATGDRLDLFCNEGDGTFVRDEQFGARFGGLRGTCAVFADLDNDGDLDLVIADAHRADGSRGPALLVNTWPRQGFVDVASIDPGNLLNAISFSGDASGAAADFNGDGRCDLLLAVAGQPPMLLDNVTAGGHWIALDLVGIRPRDNKARSNASAIGARVEIKTGGVYQQYLVGGASGVVAMNPLRIHAGLGDHATVDWLRVIWPDAVLQSEMELAADRVARVEELPRKPSSCPYLFAWDGERFRFIADFGGVGGLGYLVAPGIYAPPDATEYLPIPDLQPLAGEYVLQSLTPLEEITYFDEAKLVAVDHPIGTDVHPREMMAIQTPPPDFELFCFSREIAPVRATDESGGDVTDRIARLDRVYAGATQRDRRFAGLAAPHAVELDFGDALAGLSPAARLVLLLHGWVEYGYSSTNLAASQAGLRTEAPTIEVQRDGRWVTVLREVGYPAGLNHIMTVDLSGHLLPGDRVLRISSNMELYWDRIVLAEHDAAAPLRIQELAARQADLHFRGYPREYSPDGRHPNSYDYDNVDRSVGWKLMAGDYTRYGDVTPLLSAADDCFVIMGHGDELTLRFEAGSLGPIPEGYRRTFLLKADSYCKDMDLYTAYPETVEPLPFHGMSGYPYGRDEAYPETPQTRAYRETYNTRRIGAR